ncbi:MAG: 9-O-acetylesterase [Prevotella sp.]|nr:9-O-acetylesterase [Prevotella sp.]
MKLKTLFFALTMALSANAQVKLLPIFTDNMVLQQQTQAPIWGETKAGKSVVVTTSWDNVSYQSKADAKGRWQVKVKTPKAGGPFTITINDGKRVTLKNVMIGEVWICTGQSNMEMPLRGGRGWQVKNHDEEVAAAAQHPNIRLVKIDRNTNTAPLTTVTSERGGWEVCSPESAEKFSATGYFFGREIEKYQNVPVGLIMDCWGGTVAEAWTSGEALNAMPYFREQVKRLGSLPESAEERQKMYSAEVEEWNKVSAAKEAEKFSDAPTWSQPGADLSGWKDAQQPGNLGDNEFSSFDGIFWIRRTIDIPAAWAGKDLTLRLGNVDDIDQTFFNGEKVGAMVGYSLNRVYTIPGRLVKQGQATLSLRVLDTGGGAGIIGYNGKMTIACGSDERSIAGTWKVKMTLPTYDMPRLPQNTIGNPNVPTVLYNAMLAPIIPYAIKGAIWYQGEANADRAYQYRDLLPVMIRDWRHQWGYDFPFYIVQLANYMAPEKGPEESAWAELREAQVIANERTENSGLACIIDIGEANDIHPQNKQEVGRRLSLLARALTYGENIEYSGPKYKASRIAKNRMIIEFDHAESGLKAVGSRDEKGFTIAGIDHKFHPAKARITGKNTIEVWADEVDFPIAVRYGWANNPNCNIYNGEGLPMIPFRTDDWQGLTYPAQ